jgi:hypothetical protein
VEEALIAVNGTVAGVAGGFTAADGGGSDFNALIAEETLREGANDVVLLIPQNGGQTFRAVPLA